LVWISRNSFASELALVVSAGVGCAPAALTPGGAQVKLMKADPPADCEDIGSVSGQGFGGDDDDAKIAMRNAAATRGANYVRLDSVKTSKSGPAQYAGTAFRCPNAR
jgi:hypothetical protein